MERSTYEEKLDQLSKAHEQTIEQLGKAHEQTVDCRQLCQAVREL